MLTALLLLLGLSGAGAGLYTILREPAGTSKTDKRSEEGAYPDKGEGDSYPKFRQRSESDEKPNIPTSSPKKPLKKPTDLSEFQKLGKPTITYSADEIISKNSKYSHHRRPILNAESLLEKFKVLEAIQIYERTESRIPDPEIKEKLRQNIEDLKSYLSRKKKLDGLYDGDEGLDESELDSDKIRPPRTDSPIPIRDLAEAIREIAEAMSEALTKGFYPPYIPPPSYEAKGFTPPAKGQEGGYQRQLPQGYFPPPVVYQVLYGQGDEFQAKFVSGYPPPPAFRSSDPTTFQDETTLTPPSEFPDLTETSPSLEDTLSQLDLPEDTFFTEEWEKYKNLPLTDRRSGKERRVNKDRRAGTSRKDRRSGEDRRKVDLFKEREEYLKRKAEEKKTLKKENKLPQGLSGKLAPYYPPTPSMLELVEIGLPEPETLRLGELRPQIEPFALPHPVEYKKTSDPRNEIELPNPVDISPPKKEPYAQNLFPEIPPIEIPKIEIPAISPDLLSKQKFAEDLPLIKLPEPEDLRKEVGQDGSVLRSPVSGDLEDKEPPEIEVVDGDLDEKLGEIETPEEPVVEEKEPEKIIHGILELKPPELDDAPFLTLTYDFSKIPHGFKLSKNYSIMEYSYYKYKPMLMKAQEFARRKMLKNALNYYRVIKSQNIPPEMRKMINRNIQDITEFMEKFLMAKGE